MQNPITDAVARTTFLVGGSYTKKGQYDVYYCGTNSGVDKKKVVIAAAQTQTAFNDTKHFGAVGDCGVAKTEKNTDPGKSGYKFDLEHKASYLCFLPYIASKEERESYKIQRIEITSNNTNIAGAYDLSSTGLSGSGESKTITLNVSTTGGLLLADQNTETTSLKNSLYVVIAPGIHSLKVKYTVLDTKKNAVMTMTKSYGSHNFAANKICDIPVSLGATAFGGGHTEADGGDTLEESDVASLYSGHNYYMWDAKENFWFGHEWDSTAPWQPTTGGVKNDNYPRDGDASRWYNKDYGPREASVNPLFSQIPNVNEMAWYVMKGNAHWDNSTQWEVFGEKHTGGIWLKKLSVIAQENNKTLSDLKNKDPYGSDMRTANQSYRISPISGKPKDSEISDYFFLPALGYYYYNRLDDLGSKGYYWSSSASFVNPRGAGNLYFDSASVSVGTSGPRDYGYVAQPFE